MVKRILGNIVFIFFFEVLCFSSQSLGDKIVFFAKKFLGLPYDPDPLGSYVRKKVLIYDEKVDCMYLTFRSVELAFSDGDDSKSLFVAVEKRFVNRGIVKDGIVVNYEDRFEYGEDMVLSGKWGKLLVIDEGIFKKVFSERLKSDIFFIPKYRYKDVKNFISNGNIIFFVKDPKHSKKGEIVGHIGILERVFDDIFLIHASGTKGIGGKVVREDLSKYLKRTKYIGFIVTYFE